MSLEDKLFEYMKRVRGLSKENAELKASKNYYKGRYLQYINVEKHCKKEIQELQAKLDSIRYLDRGEVKTIVDDYSLGVIKTLDEATDAICSLAIPKQKYLDRGEVEKMFFKELMEGGLLVVTAEKLNRFFTAICSLAIPEQKYLDRDEVEKEISDFDIEIGEIDNDINSRICPTSENNREEKEDRKELAYNKATDAICSLAIPEQKYLDRDEVQRLVYSSNLAMYDIVDRICSLALKIDRDKIIKVFRILKQRFNQQHVQFILNNYSVSGKLTNSQRLGVKVYFKETTDNIIKAIKGGE